MCCLSWEMSLGRDVLSVRLVSGLMTIQMDSPVLCPAVGLRLLFRRLSVFSIHGQRVYLDCKVGLVLHFGCTWNLRVTTIICHISEAQWSIIHHPSPPTIAKAVQAHGSLSLAQSWYMSATGRFEAWRKRSHNFCCSNIPPHAKDYILWKSHSPFFYWQAAQYSEIKVPYWVYFNVINWKSRQRHMKQN